MSPKVHFYPIDVTIEVAPGTTIVEAARLAGVPLNTLCVGNGACGKCLVLCHTGEGLSPVTLAEEISLGKELLSQGYRLGCQSQVTNNIELTIPKQSLRSWVPIAKSSANFLKNERYTQEKNDGDDGVTGEGGLGIALDLGTTTLAGYLLDLKTKETITAAAVLNPQVMYGADIVTRLTYIQRDSNGMGKMREALFRGVEQLITELLQQVKSDKREVKKLIGVGNGFMHHSFLGCDLESFAEYPYEPLFTHSVNLRVNELWVKDLDALSSKTQIEMLPLVGGFVGSDLLAGLLATGICSSQEPFLYLDLGTNNEVALGDGQRILVTATCAGPAFEGGMLSCGMRAQPGAIHTAEINQDKITFDTIDHVYPQGICGSGAIRLFAELFRKRIVDELGRLLESNGIIRGQKAYVIVQGESPIGLTQKDIEELQKAKAAVFAAARILVGELGISFQDIQRVYVAGAFGAHLSFDDAKVIGLLPKINTYGRFESVGNAAGDGARLALLYEGAKQDLMELLNRITAINLAVHPKFNDEFIQAMFLPHEDKSLF